MEFDSPILHCTKWEQDTYRNKLSIWLKMGVGGMGAYAFVLFQSTKHRPHTLL